MYFRIYVRYNAHNMLTLIEDCLVTVYSIGISYAYASVSITSMPIPLIQAVLDSAAHYIHVSMYVHKSSKRHHGTYFSVFQSFS